MAYLARVPLSNYEEAEPGTFRTYKFSVSDAAASLYTAMKWY